MTGMDCGAVRDLLAERSRGELDPARSDQLDRHIATCEQCAADLAFVHWLRANPLEPPTGLAERIRAAVREDQGAGQSPREQSVVGWRSRLRMSRTTWVLASAAVAVLALGTSTLFNRSVGPSDDEVWTEFFDGVRSVWVAGDGVVADAPVLDDLSGLSDDDLAVLLQELEG